MLKNFHLFSYDNASGGYNTANAARCWTYLTSLIVGSDIPFDIPEHKVCHIMDSLLELH